MNLYYVAWEGQIFTCRLRTHVLVEQKDGQKVWFALIEPAGVAWFPTHMVAESGAVQVPSNVVRRSREEAEADVTIGSLRRMGKKEEH